MSRRNEPSEIFYCFLAAPQPTLDHYQADSFASSMLITVFMVTIIGFPSPPGPWNFLPMV